jgi:hypothetical protein
MAAAVVDSRVRAALADWAALVDSALVVAVAAKEV